MTDTGLLDGYGTLIEPATLRIERLLPGPAVRVWAYLTESDLRRQWLAAGTMDLVEDQEFELTWRNDELTDPPGQRPSGFGEEHRMKSRITEIDPPRKLTFTWGDNGEVSFELETRGDDVLLSVTHRRIAGRDMLLKVSAGWHAHLDILAARMNDREPAPFWDEWAKLQKDYEARLPA